MIDLEQYPQNNVVKGLQANYLGEDEVGVKIGGMPGKGRGYWRRGESRGGSASVVYNIDGYGIGWDASCDIGALAGHRVHAE